MKLRILTLRSPGLLHFFQLPEQLAIRAGALESICAEDGQARADHDDENGFELLRDGISRAHVLRHRNARASRSAT